MPVSWSQLATKVVVSKYFYGDVEGGQRENSVKQLVHRVCRTIADWGRRMATSPPSSRRRFSTTN